MTMEKKMLKIEIQKQSNYEGTTYFYLYVNDQYVTLKDSYEKIKEVADNAVKIFKAGDDERKIVESYNVEL